MVKLVARRPGASRVGVPLSRVALCVFAAFLSCARFVDAAQGDCGQPLTSGDGPSASDALFILRAAVGSETCDACICDVNASGATTAGDALLVLNAAVGAGSTLTCSSCGGAVLYAVGTLPAGDGTLYRIDDYAVSPSAQVLGGGNLSLIGDIAVDPTTGRGYGVLTTGSLVEINLATGQLISSVAGAGTNPNALTFTDDGTLYSWGGRPVNPGMDTNLYVLDKTNGGGQVVLDTGYVAAGDLAYDSTSGFLYGSADTGELIRIDLDAKTTTPVGGITGLPFGVRLLGLDIEPTSGTMYALAGGTLSSAATVYTVDKSTAGLTLVGNVDGAHNVIGGWGLSFGPSEQ